MNSSSHTNAQSRELPGKVMGDPRVIAVYSPGSIQKLLQREALASFVATIPAHCSGRYAYHRYRQECANANVASISLRTFYRELKSYRAHVLITAVRRGQISAAQAECSSKVVTPSEPDGRLARIVGSLSNCSSGMSPQLPVAYLRASS